MGGKKGCSKWGGYLNNRMKKGKPLTVLEEEGPCFRKMILQTLEGWIERGELKKRVNITRKQ